MESIELKGVTIPIISCLVYFAITGIKRIMKNEKLFKYIPIIAAALGFGLGVFFFFIMPSEAMITNNIWVAAFVGATSGLAATGTNQIFKQLTKKETKE